MARKILLADDSVTAQNMGRKILADAGYEVITVNNGSAALKKISEQKPDLIVLDVYMPGYSGLEVCQRLKEVPETSRIPVLLTVGKLEPFKPEEAKRVRAEGFIVKPFEASELLSALSKLEDKVVPRSESSKPGRFARAIAAVEQSSRDKSEAAEEDLGWKNRISFPKKKKNKEAEVAEDGDDPAIYNAVNKDLRTVVPHEEPHKEHAAPVQEDAAKTVDVAAVVPADLPKDVLPKDVTPEEIAAIAAAAAQVQAAAAGSRETSETPVEAKIVATEPPSTVTPAEPRAETKSEERVEARSESKAEEVPPATFAEHKGEEKTEPAEVAAAKKEEPKDISVAPSQAEVVAAISALEAPGGKSWEASSSGNGAGHSAAPAADLPVTMAAAAAGSSTGPRWTAVAVAIDAAEAAISLEQEMQKAQAVAVVAETPRLEPVATPEAAPVSTESIAAPAAGAEPVVRAATHEESELAHALSAAANVAAETVSAAGNKETAAAASPIDSLPSAPEQELASPVQAAVQPAEPSQADAVEPKIAEEYPAPVQQVVEREAEKEEALPKAEGKETSTAPEEASGASTHEPRSAEPVSAVAEAPVQKESATGGTGAMAEKRESELAASTAAAWASWRQIRSDEPKTSEPAKARKHDDEDDESTPTSEAAMAVAAGAEKSPEEGAPGADPRAIANIVDSVLAELRPKIVEEISRKLGEKK
ncbi:MAG: response regulator [Acidobacteriia bacterium]|nr:response regulator [Terriglobia bacterium]